MHAGFAGLGPLEPARDRGLAARHHRPGWLPCRTATGWVGVAPKGSRVVLVDLVSVRCPAS